MERLTERLESGAINVKYASQHETAIHRLVTIEDILGDNYDLSRLRELMQAEREDRVVIIPKDGSTLFRVGSEIKEARVPKVHHEGGGKTGCSRNFFTITSKTISGTASLRRSL